MKNLFFIVLIFVGSFFSAQQQWQDNRFSEGENENIISGQNADEPGPGQNDDNGCLECDDEPVPIDGYTTLLFLIAIGIIIATQKRRTKFLLD